MTLTSAGLSITDAVLTFSGTTKNISGVLNNSVEIYNPDAVPTDTWTIRSTNIPIDALGLLYPRMTLFPDGKVFYSGHQAQSYLFDPSRPLGDPLQWTAAAANTNDRHQGSAVLLPLVLNASGNITNNVTILTMGGCDPNLNSDCHSPAILKTATKYSRNGNSWTSAGSMITERDMLNAVLLPDGKVLVTGGQKDDCADIINNCPGVGGHCIPVYTGELYDPVANTWTEIPPPPTEQQRPRQYHSGGILLPDASVLVDGGETDANRLCFPNKSAQIYKPGYFFRPDNTTRPIFDLANPFPGGNIMYYGQTFTINAPNANQIAKVVLIRTSSVTHSFNSDQRYLELNIASRPNGNSLVVNAPANQNIGPLGYYMMFLVKETTPGNIDTRIPSEAKFVQLSTANFLRSLQTRPRR